METIQPFGPGRRQCQRRRRAARLRTRATNAKTVEHAGTGACRMSHIRNTRPYHGGARSRPAIIDEIHDQWCRDNGYPVVRQQALKPTSPQARRRKISIRKLRVQA
jgi:hypothetical protein